MHNLENLIKIYNISSVENYVNTISQTKDLDDKISCCNGLFPYEWDIVKNEIEPILTSFLETINKSTYTIGNLWGNIIKPNEEIGVHINTENGYDVIENTNQYVGILNLKFNSLEHRGVYFADNSLKVNEYKPNVQIGDVIVFSGNIYHRIPVNTSNDNMVILTITFEVN
jgi:hypothetical protein